jgi:putative hydrolase of the HAD superfamily
VVFDLGEVLSQSPTHLTELAGLLDVPEPVFAAAYWRPRRAYDAGCSGAAYWRSVGAELGVRMDDALVEQLVEVDSHGWTTLHPDSVPLLLDVKAAGHGLAMLSNLPRELAERVRGRSWSEAFDLLVFSCDVGANKPDPAIYRAVVEGIADCADAGAIDAVDSSETGCPGETAYPAHAAGAAPGTPSISITFFDDRPENVAAALEEGWRARVWAGHADALSFLAEAGILGR